MCALTIYLWSKDGQEKSHSLPLLLLLLYCTWVWRRILWCHWSSPVLLSLSSTQGTVRQLVDILCLDEERYQVSLRVQEWLLPGASGKGRKQRRRRLKTTLANGPAFMVYLRVTRPVHLGVKKTKSEMKDAFTDGRKVCCFFQGREADISGSRQMILGRDATHTWINSFPCLRKVTLKDIHTLTHTYTHKPPLLLFFSFIFTFHLQSD